MISQEQIFGLFLKALGERMILFPFSVLYLFVLLFNVQVNNYGHVKTVS